MNSARQAAIFEGVRCILADVYGGDDEFTHSSRYARYLNGGVHRDVRVHKQLDKLIDHVFREPDLAAKFTRESVQDALTSLLMILPPEVDIEQIREGVQRLVGHLDEYATEQIVFIPLAGFEVELEDFSLGDFTIHLMTDQRAERLVRQIEQTCSRRTDIEEDWREHLRESCTARINLLRGKVYAEYRVVAEQSHAMALAKTRIHSLIEVFRYSLLFVRSTAHGLAIGVEGEHASSVKYAFLIPADCSGSSWSQEDRRVWDRFVLDDLANQEMRDAGVFLLGEMLQAAALTDFQRNVLQAVHWCADSRIQMGATNEFLSLVIALETLFTPEQGKMWHPADTISGAVAEGVAVTISDDPAERQRWKSATMDLYDKRSRIAHGQSLEVSNVDHARARDVIRAVMPRVIRLAHENKFLNRDAFLDNVNLRRTVLSPVE